MVRRGEWVMALALVGLGCRPTPEGVYTLDIEESKACVVQAAKEHLEEKKLEARTLAAMESLRTEFRIEKDGTFTASTSGPLEGTTVSDSARGTWTRRHSRLTLSVPGDEDMICDIDGKRLRCFQPMKFKLIERYVLIKG